MVRTRSGWGAWSGSPVSRIGSAALAVLVTTFLGVVSPRAQVATDEADEWSILAPRAAHSLLLDATRLGEAWVVVGERGHILRSTDEGQHWNQVRVPTRAMLCAITEAGATAWVVGHDSRILSSEDEGQTWVQRYAAPEEERPLFDVWFGDPDHGLAVGAYGLILATEDGGQTWQERPIGQTDTHFYDVDAAVDGSLYLSGEFGACYRSDDGGQSWIELNTPYEGSFFGTLPLRDGTVLLFGLRGHLYRSENRGDTWTEVPTGTTASLLNGVETRDGTVFLVGLSGAVLRSEDGGRHFVFEPREDRVGLAEVVETSRGLLLIGEHGVLGPGREVAR